MKFVKLKNIVSRKITDGPHVSPDYVDIGVPFISGSEISGGKVVFREGTKMISESLHNVFYKRTPTRRNDILLVKNGSIGNCAFVDTDLKFSIWVPLALIRVKDGYNPKYVYYTIISEKTQTYLRENASDTAQPNLSISTINNILVKDIDINSQNKIALFLDEKCSKIDQEVSLLEQKSILLDEYKNVLIYETVTKGLNKNAGLKDSGVEWIGEIPKNWTVNRLKDKLNIQKGSVFTDDLIDDEGLYPYINGGVKPSGWTNAFNCMEKTIAVSEGGASSGYSQYMETKFWAGSHCYKITPRRNDNSKYYYYLLKGFEKEIQSAKTGSAMPNLQKSKFTNLIFSFTGNLLEQNSIVEFLDLETKKIEKQIELINKKVELLKEYKQSLIYEAVTGQLEIE